MNRFFKGFLGQGPPPNPLPADVHPATLSRREFFAALSVTAVVASPAYAMLEQLLPTGDAWRFGWIRQPEGSLLADIYYGIDMADPEKVEVHQIQYGNHMRIDFDTLKAMGPYQEAAAEIQISQGHAGMKATGGVRMRPGDEADFSEIDPGEHVTMLEGDDDRAIEQSVHRAARGRDATEAELKGADDGLTENVAHAATTGPNRDQRIVHRANLLGYECKFRSGGRIEILGGGTFSREEAENWLTMVEADQTLLRD